MTDLDRIDLQLLRMLQENGRVSQHDLARAVGLSAPAVSDRLRKLEERGVVRGYTAIVDPRALGQDITAFIAVGISGSKYYGAFRSRVQEVAEVVECHSVTGEGSHLLKVRVARAAGLEEILAEIQSWPGVQWTTTSIVLSTQKENGGVPIPPGLEEREEGGGGPGPTDLLLVPFRHHT